MIKLRAFSRIRSGLLAALVVPILAGPALAQDPEDVRIGITYTPGFRPGLVMTPVTAGPGLEAMGVAVDSVLRQDLDFSDRFQIIESPEAVPEGPINYGLWNQIGAVWLVTGDLSGTSSAPILRVTLHDVVFGEVKDVRAFSLPSASSPDSRMAVHRSSDEVVRWATGDPGIAATRIVFRRKVADGSDIFAIDYDGRNLRRLTQENGIVYSPMLSPDGGHLLFVSYRDGGPAVYERNLATGRTRTIASGGGLNITPSYSADGSHILLAKTAGQHSEVFEMQRQPLCCSRRLTFTSSGDALNPSQSPDGSRMVVTASPLGLPHIYVMSADGGNPSLISRYVFGERGYAAAPEWSPRGDRIAFHAWIENSFQISTAGPDGSDRRVLTSRGSNEDPTWAPDGRHLLFASSRGGRNALWVLDTVSGRVRGLTENHVDQMPDWSGSL
ncbi:MAG: hypothetical protein ABFS14_01910 [Gemmatimonadota bacterium]